MTDDDLKNIEERLAAATPGPWDLFDSRVETWHFTSPSGDAPREGTMQWQILGGQGEGQSSDHGWAVLHGKAGRGTIHPSRGDLLLAANAPTDIKAMAAAIRELWQLLDLMRDQDGYQAGVVEGRRECVEQLRVCSDDCKGYDLAHSRGLAQAVSVIENLHPLPPPLPHYALAAEVERLRTENAKLREETDRLTLALNRGSKPGTVPPEKWAAVDEDGNILRDQVDVGIADTKEEIEELLASDAWRNERHRYRITRIWVVD